LNFLESRCASNGVKVVCRFSPDLPETEADAAQLKQVFVNLIVNALQAMPDGGHLRINTRVESRKIFVVVEDTGVGMEQEVLDKIFTPFFTTKEIGLAQDLDCRYHMGSLHHIRAR
jgi:signal transduction histidine kinase